VLLVHLEVTHAFVVAAVEIGGSGNAGLLRGLHEGIENAPAQPLLLNAPLAANPVELRERCIQRAVARRPAMMVLVLPERRQDIGPAPSIIAGNARPLIVVARLPAHVNHAVDARAAAQGLAAGVAQRPAVEARHRLGAVQPVGARVADAIQIPHGNVDPVVIVRPPRLDEQYAALSVGAQPIGHQRAGGTCADDDVVERRVTRAPHALRRKPWAFPQLKRSTPIGRITDQSGSCVTSKLLVTSSMTA
jgi:hypothetical protein